MSRFNFTGLFAVTKALYLTTTKDKTNTILVSEKIKDGTVINFKNGSSITLLPKQVGAVKGNRAMIHRLYNNDGTVDYLFDKKAFDEVVSPFCRKSENNDIDGQLLYVSSNNGKLDKTALSNVVNEDFREQYYTSATFHDVINYLLFSMDEIGESEVVRCLSALSDLIMGLEQERIDKLNSYAEKLFGGSANEL